MNSPGLCLAMAGESRVSRAFIFQPLKGLKFKLLIANALKYIISSKHFLRQKPLKKNKLHL